MPSSMVNSLHFNVQCSGRTSVKMCKLCWRSGVYLGFWLVHLNDNAAGRVRRMFRWWTSASMSCTGR